MKHNPPDPLNPDSFSDEDLRRMYDSMDARFGHSFTAATAYILQLLGSTAFIIGGTIIIPSAFSYGLGPGLVFLGVFMITFGAILNRI